MTYFNDHSIDPDDFDVVDSRNVTVRCFISGLDLLDDHDSFSAYLGRRGGSIVAEVLA